MKILTIFGASKTGNTTEVMRCFKEELNAIEHYDCEDLYLQDVDIPFCAGCHNCIMLGEDKCPHHHVIKSIEDKILEADILILATPGYMFSVTGIMKNFLDHVAYKCHRPKYFDKKIFLVSSCTKWQKKGVFLPMETWGSGSGFTSLGKLSVDLLPFPLKEEELLKRRLIIRKSAIIFNKDVKQNKKIRPDFGGIAIFYAFRTFCKKAPQILKADYRYFQEINAYDKNAKWYISDAKLSPIKLFLARRMEKKMGKALDQLIDKDKLQKANGRWKNKL